MDENNISIYMIISQKMCLWFQQKKEEAITHDWLNWNEWVNAAKVKTHHFFPPQIDFLSAIS